MKVHEYNEMMAYLLRPRQKFAKETVKREDFKDGLSAEIKKRIERFENLTGEKYVDQPAWKKFDIREGNWKGSGAMVKLTDEMKANIKEYETRTGKRDNNNGCSNHMQMERLPY